MSLPKLWVTESRESAFDAAAEILAGSAVPVKHRPAEKRDLLLGLGFVSCQTCDGKGEGPFGDGYPASTCPVCGGLGVRPSNEMIERAKGATLEFLYPTTAWLREPKWINDRFRGAAIAALLAGIGGAESR